jgi:hypothetical protein
MAKVLWGTKPGAPDWDESILTETEALIPDAMKWAEEQGFRNIRIQNIEVTPPDFTGTINI